MINFRKDFTALFFIIGLLTAHTAYSQAVQTQTGGSGGGIFYLNKNNSGNPNDYERGFYIGPHVLGEEFDRLMNKYESAYTYFVEGSGGYAVKQKRIEKAPLYRSVNKVLKSYEKLFKKGKITLEDFESKSTKLVKLAVELIGYNTDVVESDLKNIKSVDEIEDYLLALKLLK